MKFIKPFLLSLCLCTAFHSMAAEAAHFSQTAAMHRPFDVMKTVYLDVDGDTSAEVTDESSETEETEPVPVILDTDDVSTDEILMYSDAGIVMDVDTGKVLYYKNPFDIHYPASLTKIMTTLVALENSALDETVTVSQNALDQITWDSTRLGVLAGQEITMEEALYAVMVTSANDIANAVAEHISGSMDEFCALMTKRSKELGCYHTNFVNPNGLHDDNHYSSAYDIAMMARAALADETFRTIASANTYTYTSEILRTEEEQKRLEKENDGEIGPYVLYNHHKIINGMIPYEYVYGGKTGYTKEARFTLATFAKKDDVNLICVMMDCPGKKDYIYTDTTTALDYCFDRYEALAGSSRLSAVNMSRPEIYSLIPDANTITLPEAVPNAEVSRVTLSNYQLSNFMIYRDTLTAAEEDDAGSLEKSFAQKASELIDFSGPDKKSVEAYIAGIAIIAVCVVFLMLIIQQLVKIIKRKRRRIRYNQLKRRRLASEAEEKVSQNTEIKDGEGQEPAGKERETEDKK